AFQGQGGVDGDLQVFGGDVTVCAGEFLHGQMSREPGVSNERLNSKLGGFGAEGKAPRTGYGAEYHPDGGFQSKRVSPITRLSTRAGTMRMSPALSAARRI